MKSYDFSFGFCIPGSTNTWDAVYQVPPLDDDLSECNIVSTYTMDIRRRGGVNSSYFIFDELIDVMANVLACCQGVVVDIMATMFDVFFSRQSVVWTVSRFLACLSTLWRGASRLHPRFQLQLLHVQWTTCEGSELELENICSTQRIPPHDLDFSERIHS